MRRRRNVTLTSSVSTLRMLALRSPIQASWRGWSRSLSVSSTIKRSPSATVAAGERTRFHFLRERHRADRRGRCRERQIESDDGVRDAVVAIEEIEYEHAGAMQNRPRDEGPEDLWHLTMSPMAIDDPEHGELVPEARVDVLAMQEMLDEVEGVSLESDGGVRISGVKKQAMVMINLYLAPPIDEDDDEK